MALRDGVVLQPHQAALTADAAAAAVAGLPFRKLLIHALGSGKSLSALSAADTLGQPITAVVPASLRTNMQGEVGKFLTAPPPNDVISYTGLASGRTPPTHTGTIIFDEAQRLTSPGSAQAQAAKDLAASSQNVIALSGTPIRNRPGDLAPLIEILTGNRMTPDQFEDRYVGERKKYPGGLLGRVFGTTPISEPVVAHRDELAEMLKGKIDYYKPTAPTVGVESVDVPAEMTRNQTRLYKAMYGKLPWLLRYKMRWDYPLTDDELRQTQSFLTGPRQVALSTLPYQGKPDPLGAFKDSGKLQAAYGNLRGVLDKDPRTKAIVYSNFVDAGLRPYAAGLSDAGVPHAIFHGGMSDEERKTVVNDFNEGRTRVALIGPSGAEGISLKGAQLTQILDPHWHGSRTDQAAGRGLRFDAHRGLPPELQRMRVERYTATLPKGMAASLLAGIGLDDPSARHTTDTLLRLLSSSKDRNNAPFNDFLQEIGTRKEANDLVSLLDAKRRSDAGDYDGKAAIIRRMIDSDPAGWFIDTPAAAGVVGLTHRATRFRIHLPTRVVRTTALAGQGGVF